MRKLMKKYLLGGGLTPPSYAPSYNSGSDFYNNVMNHSFNSIGNSFTDAVLPKLQAAANTGDLTATSLLTNLSLSKGIDGLIKSGGGGIGNFLTGILSSPAAGVLGSVGSSLMGFVKTRDKVINSNDLISQDFRNILGLGLTMINPLAGLAYQGLDKLGAMSDASKGLGFWNDAGNMAMSFIPGSTLFSRKTRDYKASNTLKLNSDAYGGTLAFANKAALNAGANLVFGAAAANAMSGEALLDDTTVQNIMAKNEIAQAGANNPLLANQMQMRNNGGYQLNSTYFGKDGLKLDRDFAKRVVKLSKGKKSKVQKIQEEIRAEEVAEFKNGGTVNVIPEGALHKNKHHLENVDEKFEDVTAKGIPVITESEGGDIVQHAEVEREEIIFNLDVTKQLEKLMEVGTDEAAIEAGKLLVHEILENTVDNTGLLNKIE